VRIAIALVIAFLSTTLTNLGYIREHEAAAAMPELSVRRPLRSLKLLVENREWMIGFGMESSGFLLYAAALALAPLALVQSVAAGGIGLLAFFSRRITRQRFGRRAVAGIVLSVVGLLALSISLAGGGKLTGHAGSIPLILLWLGCTGLAAAAVLLPGSRLMGAAVANGIAGGLFFSIGDISTKLATEWGPRSAFVVTIVAGYLIGTTLLQLGYQSGAALTVAGLATLLTNVLPIAAGTVVLEEPVPSGALGAARVLAFACVIAGAALLSRPLASQGQATSPAAAGEAAAEAQPPSGSSGGSD
jgi:hypothetical protein